jgi:hypothetical protein
MKSRHLIMNPFSIQTIWKNTFSGKQRVKIVTPWWMSGKLVKTKHG